ncbi:CBASS cGAMP-activated phospholipase [Senegalia massiliensis]|nr:CBASS cGAMP-activated phospholipase [Senegalia massiliensis]
MALVWKDINSADDILTWKPENKKKFKVLAIDGGGIKGVFPAKYLQMIENKIGGNIYEHFDLIVGTSTGGIIALALSIGVSTSEIVKLYKDLGKNIFKSRLVNRVAHPITHALLKSKYDNKNLTVALKDVFGDKKIKDAKTLLCIPSIDFYRAKPKVYKTPHSHYHLDRNLKMWQVALATSAAPTYFPAAIVDKAAGTPDYMIDGGLWANNPSVIGICEALHFGCNLKDIQLLSIGTGHCVYKGKKEKALKSGFLSWGTGLVDFTMNAQNYGNNAMAMYLLPEENFDRIDFETGDKINLDSVDDKSIEILMKEAERAYGKTCPDIENKFFI